MTNTSLLRHATFFAAQKGKMNSTGLSSGFSGMSSEPLKAESSRSNQRGDMASPTD